VSHYEITHALGTPSHRQVLTVEQLLDLSREVGRVPVERDALYNVIEQPSALSVQRSAPRSSADRSMPIADR
jgi:2-iminoacetate synthase ThiH